MNFEVKVAGTTVEMDNFFACEKAYKDSHGDAQLIRIDVNGRKLVKAKKAKGFRVKDIARFKN